MLQNITMTITRANHSIEIISELCVAEPPCLTRYRLGSLPVSLVVVCRMVISPSFHVAENINNVPATGFVEKLPTCAETTA